MWLPVVLGITGSGLTRERQYVDWPRSFSVEARGVLEPEDEDEVVVDAVEAPAAEAKTSRKVPAAHGQSPGKFFGEDTQESRAAANNGSKVAAPDRTTAKVATSVTSKAQSEEATTRKVHSAHTHRGAKFFSEEHAGAIAGLETLATAPNVLHLENATTPLDLDPAAPAQALAQVHAAIASTARGSKTGWLSCIAVSMFLGYIMKSCFSETSCWNTWPCCLKLRLWLHVDKNAEFQLQATVHKGKDLGAGNLFIAILPRRGTKPGKPKVVKGKSACTVPSTDHLWEQRLQVEVPQGSNVLQVAVFKNSLIGSPVLLAWGTIDVDDLLDDLNAKGADQWVDVAGPNGSAGSVRVQFGLSELPMAKSKKGHKGVSGPPVDMDVPNTQGMSEMEKLEAYSKALTGPLKQVDRSGTYQIRHFCLDKRKDIWVWSWWESEKDSTTRGKKPMGRIPVLSITTIIEVPDSISEFIVRFRDPRDHSVDMMLMRHSKPREWWVKTLRLMCDLLRDMRKRHKSHLKPTEHHTSHDHQSAHHSHGDSHTAEDDDSSEESSDE